MTATTTRRTSAEHAKGQTGCVLVTSGSFVGFVVKDGR